MNQLNSSNVFQGKTDQQTNNSVYGFANQLMKNLNASAVNQSPTKAILSYSPTSSRSILAK